MTSPDFGNVPLGDGAEGRAAVNKKREGFVKGLDGRAGGREALVNLCRRANAQGIRYGQDGQPQNPSPNTAPGGGVRLRERGIFFHADSIPAPGLRGERNVAARRKDREAQGITERVCQVPGYQSGAL